LSIAASNGDHPSMTTAGTTDLTIGHPIVESVSADGGYLSAAHLELSPHLNAIVGKKGAGKSTLMALIRFCLDLYILPELEAEHRQIVEANLGGGTITNVFRTRHGARYRVSRSIGRPPSVSMMDGTPVPLPLESLFPARVLAQTEITGTAKNRVALLRLLDSFLEAGGKPLADDIEAAERKLARNAADILRVQREMAEDEDRARELPPLRAELEALAGGARGDADDARGHYRDRATRARERAALAAAGREVSEMDAALFAFMRDLERRIGALSEAQRALAHGETAARFSALASKLEELGTTTGALLLEAANAATATTEAVARITREVEPIHARGEHAFADFLRRHPEEEKRAAERTRLEYRAAEAELAAQRVEAKKREEKALLERRAGLLRPLFALRRQLTEKRKAVRDALNRALGDVLTIKLTEASDTRAYEELLTTALTGSRVGKDVIAELARLVRPDQLARAVMEGDPTVIAAVDDSKTGHADRARKIIDFLAASGRVFEIQTARVDDAVEVFVEHEGYFKPSHAVSHGQKSSSVLPILFAGAEGPLGIDQPEDALDKTYLYDVIVPGVAAAKKAQQLFFVTHDANIPALALVDALFLVESTGLHATVRRVSEAEAKAVLERRCEGHEDALRRRAEAYGYEVRRRDDETPAS
jgi:hypothetical protein